MKKYHLDSHSVLCPDNKEQRNFCETHPRIFLFFLNNQFHILTYYSCKSMHGHIDFKMDMIKEVLNKFEILPWYDVRKSVVEDDLKEYRLRNKNLKKYLKQVNYIYSDNANKIYYITTEVDYFDHLTNQDEIDKSYKEAHDYLNDNGYSNYFTDLKDLYLANKVYQNKDTELQIFKTIDHLVKQIKTN